MYQLYHGETLALSKLVWKKGFSYHAVYILLSAPDSSSDPNKHNDSYLLNFYGNCATFSGLQIHKVQRKSNHPYQIC